MSFSVTGTAIQPVLSPISLSFGTSDYVQVNFPLNIGSLITQSGPMNADDQNGNGKIIRGETIDHDNPNIPLIDPIPDLNNATVLGVGYMGGFVSGLAVRYPILLVQSGGQQYLIYPDGVPDLITMGAGTINTTLHFYANAEYYPGGPIPCFTRGTGIATPDGEIAVECLRIGDLVLTKDHGPQPIRWIGSRKISTFMLEMKDNLRPIRICAGALGEGIPREDLLVSPQHRILVRSKIVRNMLGSDEALVAAKHLTDIAGIGIATDVPETEYFHFLLDRHEVVFSNGAETESLFVGPMALQSVGQEALEEIFEIFPELRDGDHVPVPARSLVSGREGRRLANRHHQNRKSLIIAHAGYA